MADNAWRHCPACLGKKERCRRHARGELPWHDMVGAGWEAHHMKRRGAATTRTSLQERAVPHGGSPAVKNCGDVMR